MKPKRWESALGGKKYNSSLEKMDAFLFKLGEHTSNAITTKLESFFKTSRKRKRLRYV